MARQKSRFDPVIRRAPLSVLLIYEINENELHQIEQSASGGVLLNFATFFLSDAASFLTTLLTVDLAVHRVKFDVFVIVCVTTFIAGVVCLVLWRRSHRSMRALIEEIKRRMPDAEGVQQPPAVIGQVPEPQSGTTP